jgi:hypothetical protein
MSEPLAERLGRLTPDAGGLDRDALLFAAGRASVRPGRRWKALASVLAASQLLTLLLLWPRTPATTPFVSPGPSVAVEPVQLVPPDPSSWWSLRERAFASEGDLPAPAVEDSLLPAGPPLLAFVHLPATLLN